MLDWLAANVPASRLNHILRVEAMAVELAVQHGLNVDQAAQSGLMHDLAKYFKPERLLKMARSADIELDPILVDNPHLLHADISAIVAQNEFGVVDEAVLQAIRHHTLGQPEMPPLSCVVYLADSLEPGRGDNPALQSLRQISRENLYQGVWLTAEASMELLFGRRCLIHPRTIATRNWAMQVTGKTPTVAVKAENQR
ncbi:bis(5'-nucleosyl)-tetraphosphatase (symmetrical) YqeK [Neosynechococcus sphagnicola]|uniref:bis(5'-nucleosyl)-tetraphosphatase (symmetrical) YqeK n=1 Tax=Neosynechococcus sphagnicola TaxID=1501145 RepID=UPI000B228CC6|nr:bis(5'-nucleosyl)-tetraphosphatase (symmetrical) YqeK [Neosynechococcus sphagnicola]